MLTLSNVLLVSSATVIVHSGGLFWLNPVAMVLFMLCSAVVVEWLLLKPCCAEMAFGMFMFVKVMLSLISVMSPPPCLCSLSVRMVV